MLHTNKILQLIGVQGYKSRVSENPEQHENVKGDWNVLESEVKNCTKCSLHKNRTQTVFGCGNNSNNTACRGDNGSR